MKTFAKLLGISIVLMLSSFVSLAQISDVLESKDAKSLGRISLNFPENGHEFTLREDKVFKWYCADNLVIDQEYCYYMKIVKMKETDNPETVINNSAYFEHTSDTIDYYWSISSEYLDTVYFASGQYFAWQVNAYTADTVFAQSQVFTFKGPPPFESFKSGRRTVYTTTFTHIDENWDSLCGYGNIKLYNHYPAITVPVYFENIDAEYSGSYFYQRGGTVQGTYKDTFNIQPDNITSVLTSQMYLDSLILTENEAKVGCQFSPSVIIDKDTLSYQFEEWINLDGNDRPYSKFIIGDTIITNDSYVFNIADSCFLYASNYKYYPGFYGNVKYFYGSDSLEIVIPNEAKELDYFDFTLEDSININNQLGIRFSSGTLDCSDGISPGVFGDSLEWRGVYFNEFKINEVKQDDVFAFELTNEPLETIKRDSSSWMAYITENKLIVHIDTTFNNPISGSYNYFSAEYDHIKINNLNDTLVWDVRGEIYIPYLQDFYYSVNIPCKNNVILLAETNVDSEFQPFPLYEFGLYQFSVLLDEDTISGEIDYEKMGISISLPAITPGSDRYTVIPYFNISALDIFLDGTRLISGANYSEINIYGSCNYPIQIKSYDGSNITYTLNIELEEFVNTEDLTGNSKIQIYPNPAVDYVQISGLTESSVISLLDINGRELLKRNADKETEIIDISTFESGVYFVKIRNSKEYISKKIIKL